MRCHGQSFLMIQEFRGRLSWFVDAHVRHPPVAGPLAVGARDIGVRATSKARRRQYVVALAPTGF